MRNKKSGSFKSSGLGGEGKKEQTRGKKPRTVSKRREEENQQEAR